ncbi:MAG: flagellar biosynthesis protein FlhB [Phycisphaeraceae bacterium]|nr:MAG: flagellar biosynthesis protein FlhB [Phycisphaeraceae bacterium]
MAEELGEKTEQPTPKRLSEARRKGQIARSQNLTAAVLLTGSVVLIVIFGQALFGSAAMMMIRIFEPEALGDVSGGNLTSEINFVFHEAVRLMAPLLLLMFFIAIAEQVIQIGWTPSMEKLRPKLSKLNPISGTKKLFSRKSAMKGLIDVLKLALVATVAWVIIYLEYDKIMILPMLTLPGALMGMVEITIKVAIWALIVLFLIGLIDRKYQSWQHNEDLKMTKQEVKDERRSSEGDMETRAKRLRMARDMAFQKMQSAVPNADVVVTNPTHFAVALRYNAETMNAPRVVAKGADYMAMQLRLIATSAGVPIVERKELARALFFGVDVGQEVPAEQYEAVAEILAYVYRLEGRMAS